MQTPNFSAYGTISARFESVATCGHPIRPGDAIGYAKRGRTVYTQCAECWARWQAENAEAAMWE